MRLRNIKNAKEILKQNNENYLDLTNQQNVICLKDYINDSKKINIEIGMGKGNFIINQALINEDTNFLGIEKSATICLKALNKLATLDKTLTNLKITSIDAILLTDFIPTKTVDIIYLNFSDPWPKKRHTKNRLTNQRFLKLYQQVLKPNGQVILKTDNDDFFKYTLEVLQEQKNVEIIYQTNDLYKELDNDFNKNNIATEYETRFHNLNKNINKVIFKFID